MMPETHDRAVSHDVPATTESPIVLVSPREPSGVSWIINGLLELGIRVDLQPTVDQIFGTGRQPASAMWLPEADGTWRLHPRASALQKWLPFLSRGERHRFRPIAPVLHVQRLPLQAEQCGPVVLFVRDLRDALHSLYRRTQPQLTWSEFVEWPHPETLLDAIDHWRLFMESWLDKPQLFVGRFEDYKADATHLLTRIVGFMGLDCTADEIARAADQSSYTAAVAAERRYRELHPHDRQVVNRAGLVGEWESLPDLQPTIVEMERRAGRLLSRLGYQLKLQDNSADEWQGLSVSRKLSSFARWAVPQRIMDNAPNEPSASLILRLSQFCANLTVTRLADARLEADEVRTLLRSLEEFSQHHAPDATASLQTLMESFSEGSAFHLARIRALLVSRQRPASE